MEATLSYSKAAVGVEVTCLLIHSTANIIEEVQNSHKETDYLKVCRGGVDSVIATALSSRPEGVDGLTKLARSFVYHVQSHGLCHAVLGALSKHS